MEQRIGIDIGRVIISGGAGPGDTSFFSGTTADMLRTPAVPGAFDAIAELTASVDGQAWLVSKCGARVRQRSLEWLDHHDFWSRTGIPGDNTRFCRERHEKAGHARDLGLTHFIDDKPDVHLALEGIVPHRFLFGPQRSPQSLSGVTDVLTWPDALREVLARLDSPLAEAR